MPDSNTTRDLRWLAGSVLVVSVLSTVIALWRESQVPYALMLDVFDLQFIDQEVPAALVCALIAVGSWFICQRTGLDQQGVDLVAKWNRKWIVGGVVVLVCAIGSLNVYRMAAISGDEYANVTQTRIFARGTIAGQWPPWMASRMAPPELANRILVADDGSGRVVTSYQPVFALVSAPFERMGARFLVNPLIAGGIVILAGSCAWHLFANGWLAGLAMMMMAGSISVEAFGMAGFATNFILLMHLVFALFFIRGLQRGSRVSMVFAGIAGGMAMHTSNQMSHLLLAGPAFFVLLRARKFREAFWLAVPYVPFALVFTFGWTSIVQGISHAHRIEVKEVQEAGRGAAPALTELAWLGKHLRLPTSRQFLQDVMSVLRFLQWSIPGLAGLLVLWFIDLAGKPADADRDGPGIDQANTLFFRVCALALACATGFYFFFPLNQGHGWGYRYLQPFLGFALLTGLAFVHARGPDSRVVTWLLLASFGSIATLLPLRISQISGFVAERMALLPCLPDDVPQVCFVDTTQIYWGPDLVQNDPFAGTKDSAVEGPDHTFAGPLQSRLILKASDDVTNEEFIRARFPGFKRSRKSDLPGTGSIWVPSQSAN